MNAADAKMLAETCEWFEQNEEQAEARFSREAKVFPEWREQNVHITEGRRQWLTRVHGLITDTPVYENAWSAGRVPRGTISTPIPDVLQRPLPKRPPGRPA